MPLTFLPGQPAVSWNMAAATVFMIGDVLVGIALTIFCVVIILTLLRGKIPVGTQHFGSRYGEKGSGRKGTRLS